MLLRSSIAIISTAAALVSFAPVPSGAAVRPGDLVEQTNDGLNIHFSEDLLDMVNEDPELYKDRVLNTFWKEADALLAKEDQQQTTEGARTLKGKKTKAPKNPKSAKTVAPSGLSAECRQDNQTACALASFIESTFVSVYYGFSFVDVINVTSCNITDTTAFCDVNNIDFLIGDSFNATECVDVYGGQVINANTTYSLLRGNFTTLVLENFPFCIPTTCDPKAFAEFVTDFSSMEVESEESIRRRTNRRSLQGSCFVA
jgi:hypothetical protein